MADYQRLITTEDIQRRYNLQGLESDRKIIQTLNNNLTKTFGIIKNYITCTTSLESKEQYFYNGTPTLENYPASEWDDLEDHLNTLYYDREEGKVYIFKYNLYDDYYWEESTDSSLLTAMSVANSQADVSEDNLRRVFYEQPTVPYNVGDIWINGSKIYRCLRNEIAESQFYQDDWIDYLQYNDSVATSNALRILGEFKETVETEYATKVLLETTANTINAEVSRVQTLAEGKSATYTEQPTPPYYRGDTYIKEVTDSETGITMNLIYVCQYTRLEGTYHEEDFAIQPGYATLSQLKVTNDSVTSTVAKVDGQDSKISSMEQTVNEINTKISNIANVTVTETTETGTMNINNVNASEPIELTIIPRIDDISYIYPGNDLYPGNDTYLNVRTLDFYNTATGNHEYYELPGDLLYYDSETYDEYKLHYGGSYVGDLAYCEIIHRVGLNENGEKYALENETVEAITPYPHINLDNGNYTISLLGYSRAYIKATLMASNIYTTQFATKVELNSGLSQTSSELTTYVNGKVSTINGEIINVRADLSLKLGKNEYGDLISMLNASADEITLAGGSKINLTTAGKLIISAGNFKLDDDGNVEANNATLKNVLVESGNINLVNDSSSISNLSVVNSSGNHWTKIYKNGIFSVFDFSDLIQIPATTNYFQAYCTSNEVRLLMQKYNTSDFSKYQYSYYEPNELYMRGENSSKHCYITPTEFYVTGDMLAQSFVPQSTEETKKNIELYKNKGLDIIKNTDIYSYNYKTEEDTIKKHIGFVIGKNYNYSKEITSNKNDGVDLYSFVSICCKAIQEQQDQIEELKEKINKLKGSDK